MLFSWSVIDYKKSCVGGFETIYLTFIVVLSITMVLYNYNSAGVASGIGFSSISRVAIMVSSRSATILNRISFGAIGGVLRSTRANNADNRFSNKVLVRAHGSKVIARGVHINDTSGVYISGSGSAICGVSSSSCGALRGIVSGCGLWHLGEVAVGGGVDRVGSVRGFVSLFT